MSFPLGRPLGNPNDSKFQRDVIKHALSLLESSVGPVLEDYPYDAVESTIGHAPIACPVNFTGRIVEQTSQNDLFLKFRNECSLMQTWYNLACEKRKRSTAGVSGLTLDEAGDLFCDFISGKIEGTVINGEYLSDILRRASEDLKACYLEGVLAQSGQSIDGAVLTGWFWGETHAAKIINEVRKTCLQYTEKDMILAGTLLLVPRNQQHRFKQSAV